jgi:hypothetical protein
MTDSLQGSGMKKADFIVLSIKVSCTIMRPSLSWASSAVADGSTVKRRKTITAGGTTETATGRRL